MTPLLISVLCFVAVLAENEEMITLERNSDGVESSLRSTLDTQESSGYCSGDCDVADDVQFDYDLNIDTDCSTKKNGLHAIAGCSPKFLTCSNSNSRVMDCPTGLIFDSRISACQWSYSIAACNKVPQDAPTIEHLASSTCASGVSAIAPCFQTYKNCTNGEELVVDCEGNLFFSTEKGECVSADQIPDCEQSQ